MKNILFKTKNSKAFVIPFSLLISTIILTISLGVSLILVKEIFFSKLTKDSLLAYYAADEALSCAQYFDYKYQNPENGTKFFPFYESTDMDDSLLYSLPSYKVSDLICSGSYLNLKNISIDCNLTPREDNNRKCITRYKVEMDLGGGEYRCADMVVDNHTSAETKYISTGYSTCDASNVNRVERRLSS
jgi:hypothetical protein